MCPIHNFTDSKRARERLSLTTARLKSFLWSEKREGEPLRGFGFVADFSETGVGLYLGEKLSVGETVRVAFETEDSTPYRGTVVWVNRYALEQKFVGHRALSFRVGIRLLFGSEAERKRFVEYVEGIRGNAQILSPGMIY